MQVRVATRQHDVLDLICPERVTDPGDAGEVLERHQQEAKLVHRAGRPGLEKAAPYLLPRLSDERILDLAWWQLKQMVVRAPGPDEISWHSDDEAMDALRDAVRAACGPHRPRAEGG
jgi:hypothetical protein